MAAKWIRNSLQVAAVDGSITVIHEDTGESSREALAGARRLVDKGSRCLAGAWAPSDSIAIAREVSVPKHVLQISPASTSGV